jgi:hypothetical protein
MKYIKKFIACLDLMARCSAKSPDFVAEYSAVWKLEFS